MRRRRDGVGLMIVRAVVLLGLVVGGFFTAPASAAPVLATGGAPSLSAAQPTSVQTVKKRPRAKVSGYWKRKASGKVRVKVTSNAKKVKLTYRSKKNKKRTALVKIRKGKGAKTLRKGSKKIKAKALATRKLRASRRVRVPKWVPPAPTAPTTPATPATPTSPATPPSLRFNLAGSVGVAVSAAPVQAQALLSSTTVSQSSTGTLLAVSADGSTRDAIASGAATVSRALVGPNGRVYLLFSGMTSLNGAGGDNCLLAEVAPATGEPICVDSSLTSVSWSTGVNGSGNPPVQFDASGALYYSGLTTDGRTVLRRFSSGTATDLINDGVQIYDFLVLPDSSVIMIGATTSTGLNWIRRLTPQGGIQTLVSPANGIFMRPFPDGNVYIGIWGGGFGVQRYLAASGAMDPRYWIAENPVGSTTPPYNDPVVVCEPWTASVYPFCGSYGAYVTGVHTTTNGKAFAIAGHSGDGLLMEYYPALERVATAITKVSVAEAVSDDLVIAGLDAASRNSLTLLNTTQGTEVPLFGVSDDVEVYHLNYVASTGRVMFDGLRFTDNRYVIGYVDIATKQVSMTSSVPSKLVDFQTW